MKQFDKVKYHEEQSLFAMIAIFSKVFGHHLISDWKWQSLAIFNKLLRRQNS